MPFKLLFYFIFAVLRSLFEPQTMPNLSARSVEELPDDDYSDLDPQYQERGLVGDAYEKLKSFLGKLNPFRLFKLKNFVEHLPESEAELTDQARAGLIGFIAERIPDRTKSQDILSRIFSFIRTGRELAKDLGIR